MNKELEGAEPRYLQVAHALREEIYEGLHQVGDQLPAIQKIADTYRVSHMTVKQALGVLRTEGLITSQPGVRAYVRELPNPEARGSLSEQLVNLRGQVHELATRVQKLEIHSTKSTVSMRD